MSSVVLTPSLMASTTIDPNVFIKLSAGRFKGSQCVADEVAFGISDSSTRDAPIEGASTKHALVGDGIKYQGQGECAFLRIAANITAGQFLKPDANGQGVVAAATNKYSAQALCDGVAGQLIEVFVCRGVA